MWIRRGTPPLDHCYVCGLSMHASSSCSRLGSIQIFGVPRTSACRPWMATQEVATAGICRGRRGESGTPRRSRPHAGKRRADWRVDRTCRKCERLSVPRHGSPFVRQASRQAATRGRRGVRTSRFSPPRSRSGCFATTAWREALLAWIDLISPGAQLKALKSKVSRCTAKTRCRTDHA